MSDFDDGPESALFAALSAESAATRAKPIPREAWRQEAAVRFAKAAVTCPHEFIGHDRSEARNSRSHLYQARRGVRRALPDTQLIADLSTDPAFTDVRHIWFELKARGNKVDPDDDQAKMLDRLRTLGDLASWGITIEDLRSFWAMCGVPMTANAAYLAAHYDGLVDSRIAKAEGRVAPAKKKRTRTEKPQPRNVASKGFTKRVAARGIRF